MADLLSGSDPHATGAPNDGFDASGPPGMPRWVKLSGIVALILVLLVIVVMVLGGQHGPGMQMPMPH